MREQILQKLHELETGESIRILHAAESGSRAWGFASPDSDYDVRFLYVRPPAYYLRLEKTRDVIERPINDALDISGWDLQKALRLLHNSNPTLFEWFGSPIVYRETAFRQTFAPLLRDYFVPRTSLHHYLGTARSNYMSELRDRETVKAKKYFYVLRPLLACRWILERSTPPPMLFGELKDAYLDKALENEVNRLLDIKMNAPEIREIPPVEPLHAYILASMEEIQARIDALSIPEPQPWEPLNDFFLREIQEIRG